MAPATFHDSRPGPGTLVFSTDKDFSVQVAAAKLSPDVKTTDGTPTLANPKPAPETQVAWTLEGDVIADWASADGFVLWAFDHAGEEVTFDFTPDTAAGMKASGVCKVVPVEIGGNVAEQAKVGFSFGCVGTPAITHGPQQTKAATK